MEASTLAIATLASCPAMADGTRADVLFQEGRAAAVGGDYPTARTKFIESQRLDPAVGTLLNIADCEEHLSHPAAALSAFRNALPQLDPGDRRYAIAKDHIAALERRTPRLTVSILDGNTSTMRVFRDGIALEARDLGVPAFVEPGLHTVTLHIAGRPDQITNVTLAEGESEQVVLDPGRHEMPAPARVSTRLPAIVAFGVGAVGFVLVGVSWAEMSAKGREIDRACDEATRLCSGPNVRAALEARDAGRTWSAVNYAAWGVGLAGLGAGALLLLTGGSSSRSVSAFAAPLPSGANVGATAQF